MHGVLGARKSVHGREQAGGQKAGTKDRKRVLGYRRPELSGGAAGVGPAVPLTHSSPEASNKSIAAWHRGLVWQSPEGAGAPQKEENASSGTGLNVFPIPDLDYLSYG